VVCIPAIEKRGVEHRMLRSAILARHCDFEIDSRCPLYPQLHTMNLNVLMLTPDLRIKRVCYANLGIQYRASRGIPGSARVTAQGKSCQCRDPSLRSQEGILPRRYICQANMGSPPGAVCREQGFRTDNLPLPPLSVAQLRAEGNLLPAAAAYPLAEPARSD